MTMARLKTSLTTLKMLERGLTGYSCQDYRPCDLLLSDGKALRVSVVETYVAWKFECFSLALDIAAPATGPAIPFVTLGADTVTSILVREEYIEPYNGDRSSLVGQDPNVQQAVKPGHVPLSATMSCLVAYGIMIEGAESRLVVAADWSPFNIVATTDEIRISAFLSESEVMPIPHYIEKYGLA